MQIERVQQKHQPQKMVEATDNAYFLIYQYRIGYTFFSQFMLQYFLTVSYTDKKNSEQHLFALRDLIGS